MAIFLLVKEHHVARVPRLGLLGGITHCVGGRVDLRRLHDVELAHLRVARQHLHAVSIVRHLERLAREDAAATVGAGLEPSDAGLEARLRRGAALLVPAADAAG